MQDLQSKLEKLESNVKSLIRKLNEAQTANATLLNENNKLKEEIRKNEAVVIEEKELAKVSTNSSPITEEKYNRVREDIKSCIAEIDDCIQMIEQ
ncbi:MAG: hypothetical protein AAGA77_04025 [Bacteroidota bacterium]